MDALVWVGADGTTTNLNGLPGVRVLGTQGLFMPPVGLIADPVPDQAGAQLRTVQTGVREVTLPLYVEASTTAGLRSTLRSFIRTLNPAGGDGRLRATTPDGATRELTRVRYAGGLEVTQARGDSGPTWQRAAIVLRAYDPFWYDSVQTEYTWSLSTPSGTFFPFFPLTVGPDTVAAEQEVLNTGDGTAYPTWTLAGPMTSATLTNSTTGEALTLTTTLTAGQLVTIDTNPGVKTVRRNDGVNLYGSLSATSSLWALPAGINEVSVSQPGATSDSYVTLTYLRRWLTP